MGADTSSLNKIYIAH